MDASELKFQKGEEVKHKLGKLPMIVVENEVVVGYVTFGSRQNNTPPIYTGKVTCGWVDDQNFSQKDSFDQEELEYV